MNRFAEEKDVRINPRKELRLSGLVVVLLMTITAHGQPVGSWQVLSNAPEAGLRHDDVFFVNPDLGWVVNLAGEIYRTTDGGDTW